MKESLATRMLTVTELNLGFADSANAKLVGRETEKVVLVCLAILTLKTLWLLCRFGLSIFSLSIK